MLALGSALLTCVSLSAQFIPGDVVVTTNTSVLGITPQGSVYTVTTRLPMGSGLLRPDPVNRGLVTATDRGLARLAPDGTVTSIFTGSTSLFCTSLDVDGEGSVILCCSDPQGPAILKYAHGRMTTLHSGPPFVRLQGGGLDLRSGDLVVYGGDSAPFSSRFYRVTLGQARHITTLIDMPFPRYYAFRESLHHDPESGDMLLFSSLSAYRLTLTPAPIVTSLHVGLPLGERVGAVDRDPADGRLVVASQVIPRPPPVPRDGVFRFDTRTATFQTVRVFTGVMFFAATVAGSRHLCGLTEARPGLVYSMLVSSPNEPGARYGVALSFGFRPGIPVGGGRKIYLNPDSLFLASATGRGPFYGFQGTLNAQGEAVAAVAIPGLAGLSGLRFFASAITVVNNRISVISDPVGVTIR